MKNHIERKANTFKALGDRSRLEIIQLLQNGEKCGCDILEVIQIGQSTLSHHMKILCEAKLVSCRREGKWTHYSVCESGWMEAQNFLIELASTKLEIAESEEKNTNNNERTSVCCSSESCSDKVKDEVKIDFLYLDLKTCTRCQGTEDTLEAAIDDVVGVLEVAGYQVTLNKLNISTIDLAIENKFQSSPTIRVNGRDIALNITESGCKDCGDICGDSVDCRTWTYHGEQYDVPPKEMIVKSILREVFEQKKETMLAGDEYELPANLNVYFNGIKNQ